MQYHYVAYNLEQGIVKGTVEGQNEGEVLEEVKQQGYKVLQVKASRNLPGIEDLFPSLFKVTHSELVQFAQQLAIMVKGGGSLQRSLELLQEESSNRVMRRILATVARTMDEGSSFSHALSQHPLVFNSRFVSVIGAGEHTGRLAPALEQLASILEKEQEAKQKAKRTMMMPAFTIGASGLMLVLMLTVLLPPLLETFESMGREVPLVTRIAMGLVSGTRENMWSLLIGIVSLIGVFWLVRRIPSAQYVVHLVQAKTPLLGPLILASELSQFSRTLAMLLNSGIPLAMALPLGISGCKNLALKRAFQAGEESLIDGQGLTVALRKYPILPKMWVELVMIGEESNTLDTTMEELGEAYQGEMENRLGNLLGMLEPLSTLAVGGVVLFIALSMFLPIYSGLDGVSQS